MSWFEEGDSDAVRRVAIQQRDEGTLHPGSEEDYDSAIAYQWGGPERPRWFGAAMKLFPAEADMQLQQGRRALITGGSGGIGFYVAKLLAAVGLVVVLPARPDLLFETQGAADAIRAALPNATVEIPDVPLDLASYESVRTFARHLDDSGSAIDVLCLNAARSGSENDKPENTVDGHEATMQVNLLSHALLVHELLPTLRRSEHVRIAVSTSQSRAQANPGAIDDLLGKRRSPWHQYGLSKAALCLFARALNKRLDAAGVRGGAAIADPGFAATGLNYQHNIALSMRLSRRGIKDTRAFHEAHANHAADAALPFAKAALIGEPNEVWMGEMVGPRASSLEAAAHLAGHLFWPPLQRNDPMLWPTADVERLWKRIGLLIGKGELEAAPQAFEASEEVPVGGAALHDEV